MANEVSAIWQILKEEESVYSLTKQNVYPNILPDQAGFPAIVYGQLTANAIETKDAVIPDGWLFELEFYADTYAELKELGNAVKAVLQYFNGDVPGLGGVRIRFQDETDGPWEEGQELYSMVQQYRLRYQ